MQPECAESRPAPPSRASAGEEHHGEDHRGDGDDGAHHDGGPRLLTEGDEIELAYARFRFTAGAVPEGMRVIPSPPPGGPELTERPTAARDRISLAQARPGAPPQILRTAVVVGAIVAVAAVILAVVLLAG